MNEHRHDHRLKEMMVNELIKRVTKQFHDVKMGYEYNEDERMWKIWHSHPSTIDWNTLGSAIGQGIKDFFFPIAFTDFYLDMRLLVEDICGDKDVKPKEYTTTQELTNHIHANAVEKGFWQAPETEREQTLQEATAISLIGTEVSEALEAHRCGDMANLREELADIVIRTLDLCGHLKIDLEAEIIAKMEINRSRPVKHGKRY